jgi:hypothetical protein
MMGRMAFLAHIRNIGATTAVIFGSISVVAGAVTLWAHLTLTNLINELKAAMHR